MNKRKRVFAFFTCIAVATVLFLSTLSMGFINLFGKDIIYQTNIGTLINSTVQSFLNCYMNINSFIYGAVALVVMSILISVLLKLSEKDGRKAFYPTALIIAFVLRFAAVVFWSCKPESDFALTYELSKNIASAPFSEWKPVLVACDTIYTSIWSSHMPFVIYQALLMKLFGTSIFMLGTVNAICGTLTCLFTGLTAKKIFNSLAGRNALLFMTFNPVCIFFTPVLTNQHPAVCIFMVGMCIISQTSEKKILRAFVGGIFLAISQLLRPEIIVVVIALAIYFLYRGIIEHEKIKALFCCSLMLFSFFAVIAVTDNALIKNGITQKSITDQNLKYKIVVGLDRETKGGWSAENEALIYDEEKLEETFNSRLKNISAVMMAEKTLYQFGTYVYPWSMRDDKPFTSDMLVRRFSTAMMSMFSVFACISIISDKKNRMKYLPLVFVLGLYMAAYAIIEVQARYNYSIIPLIVILSSNIILTKNNKNSIIKKRKRGA